jgi:hypothetical protein
VLAVGLDLAAGHVVANFRPAAMVVAEFAVAEPAVVAAYSGLAAVGLVVAAGLVAVAELAVVVADSGFAVVGFVVADDLAVVAEPAAVADGSGLAVVGRAVADDLAVVACPYFGLSAFLCLVDPGFFVLVRWPTCSFPPTTG